LILLQIFLSPRIFFLARKNLGGYAARAKGEGENNRRPVNNMLTAWVIDRVMPVSHIDTLRIGYFHGHSPSCST